jgi:L-fucose mutarotase
VVIAIIYEICSSGVCRHPNCSMVLCWGHLLFTAQVLYSNCILLGFVGSQIMPLLGIPRSITPELLYVLAKMGHGDTLVIADGNFPSDSTALTCTVTTPIRINATTSDLLRDILGLFPLDQYVEQPVGVMDRVDSDKIKGLEVPAYKAIAGAAGKSDNQLQYIERFEFYRKAKTAFAVVQTNDSALYANIIIHKGVC